MGSRTEMLMKLARASAATWERTTAHAFQGVASLETANTIYCFENGVFVSRARKPVRGFEAPMSMHDIRLVGFLAYEDGLWTLSPRWRNGAVAVLWKPGASEAQAFLLTSPTTGWSLRAAVPVAPAPVVGGVPARDPKPEPWMTDRRPPPSSMTRVMASTQAVSYR